MVDMEIECNEFSERRERYQERLLAELTASLTREEKMQEEIKHLRKDASDFHMTYRIKCDEETKKQAVMIELLTAQLDAWKEVAEHEYSLLRAVKYGDEDYPVTGALDVWAAERHPVLKLR